MKKNKLTLIIAVAFALCFYSCGNKKDHSDKAIFRYNESKGIPTLDPAFARSQIVIWPVNQIFNGLVQFNEKLEIQPCIAKKWSISSDRKTYTFTLRNDVHFHNSEVFKKGKGRLVNANDFEYSLKRITNPNVASPGAWIFANLDKTKNEGIKATSDSTLEIYLKNPFPAFLGLLSMQYCSVVPKEAVDFYGNEFRSHPVGTGPFQFKVWVEGEKLVLVKNPNYFETDSTGKKLPFLDAINISFITDKQSEFLEFIKGNIDCISGLTTSYKDELLTKTGKLNPKYEGKIKLLTSPYLNTEYLAFLLDSENVVMKGSPLLNKKVRQAINCGFDRKKMLTFLRNNMGTPATSGFVPEGLSSFDSRMEGYNYNPDKARDLLTAAGFPGGKGLAPITISTTGDYQDLVEYMQHDLSQIGIRIKIDVITGAAFRDMVANSRLCFFRASWVADYADPENYLALFYSKNFSPGGPNYTHYKNADYDKLYTDAMAEANDTLRNKLYRKMDSMIIEHAAVVPLFYDKVARFVQHDIQGMSSNPMNLLILKNVKKNVGNR